VQNALLAEQTILIDPGTVCPNCREKLKKNGQKSQFYAVFSDHKLPCKSIVVVVLNVVIHPRFHRYLARISIQTSAKLQCEQGALFSYREAEQNLES